MDDEHGAPRQALQSRQLGEDPRRHRARSGADFQNVATACPLQQLGTLAGQAMAEQGRELGRGDEIALDSELAQIAREGSPEDAIEFLKTKTKEPESRERAEFQEQRVRELLDLARLGKQLRNLGYDTEPQMVRSFFGRRNEFLVQMGQLLCKS